MEVNRYIVTVYKNYSTTNEQCIEFFYVKLRAICWTLTCKHSSMKKVLDYKTTSYVSKPQCSLQCTFPDTNPALGGGFLTQVFPEM